MRTCRALSLWLVIAVATTISAAGVARMSRPGVQTAAPAGIPDERMAARESYRDARFGMFVHWGVYSLLGQGEWVMQNRSLPAPTYEWLASTFSPVKFDAHEWVALAQGARMRYLTITARHHDGFSMFATKATPPARTAGLSD